MTKLGNCLALDLIILNVALASVNGFLAVIAFAQLMRIHMRNQQDGWTRQKVLHFMVGFSNLGYLIYFVSTIVATCNGWHCWSHACGFILMASPKILFLAVYLLLLSFWVDLCHQANEEDEEEDDDDENSINQALLEVLKGESGSPHVKDHRRCCFQGIHVGSRQKYVIMIVGVIFLFTMAFTVMIWIGIGENPIDPSVVAEVYEKLLAVMTLVLAAALGCYGFLLFFQLRKVRSEKASSEMWKVASLAFVSVMCLFSSALVAFLTDIPLFYHWHLRLMYGVKALVFLIFYYFVGSSLPSAYMLWIIRELPPPDSDYKQEQPTSYAYVSQDLPSTNPTRYWTSATSSTNQMQVRR
ncbi:uncharacterized protein LOC114739170 isoform X2 [Neltuma alba]|uniref:uncharacterized protein LOC114739170 isoform X2 n=1 Tax=Neltuma alba TaxID=207710 RepID=UPI0010A499EF|nr:uncharacterized protein LOC114739170 isoform X2 [Prosopis alba]